VRLRKPAKIFVCSTADLMAPWTPGWWIEAVLAIIALTPQHTYQLLTKSPERYAEFSPYPENVWIGATATDQGMADGALRAMAGVDASVRFLSSEPLLGPIRLHRHPLDWLIIGAQTGPGAVAPEREWVNQLLSDARGLGVPVFLKNNLKCYEPVQEWPA
jgi:protein gp37